MSFLPFPKMARLSRPCVITEKIDGTNAQVFIVSDSDNAQLTPSVSKGDYLIAEQDGLLMFARSRTRYITPEADNFGFAKWVKANADALWALGEGRHFGEWWGQGVQRGYGLTEKRFSLFNTNRWGAHRDTAKYPEDAPACCSVVPVLYSDEFDTMSVGHSLSLLRTDGSVAAPGFMDPEGVIVWHVAAGVAFKKTIKGDEAPKGLHR